MLSVSSDNSFDAAVIMGRSAVGHGALCGAALRDPRFRPRCFRTLSQENSLDVHQSFGEHSHVDDDRFDLDRFVHAQADTYAAALAEIRAGCKRSHWIWFIFPQFDGLGFSATSRHFSIKSLDEARAYLAHPILGPRLIECSDTDRD